MKRMATLITIAVAVLAGTLLSAAPAGATSPTHEQLPLCLGPFGCGTFVLDGVCSFPVQIALEGNLAQTTFFDNDGNPVSAVQTGQLDATVSNVDNGKDMFLHISGPAILAFDSDGSVNVRLIGPALLPIPGETLLYNAGTIELEVAPDGSATLVRRVGHSIDVCDILR